MKSILDPSFRYVKSTDTDIRKTFARIRREQREQSVERRGSRRPGDSSETAQFLQPVR